MNAGLGGAVGHMVRVGRHGLDGADVDNAPSATTSHLWCCRLDEEQRRLQVDRRHQLPLVRPDLSQVAFEHDSRVIDDDVDATEPIDHLVDRTGDGCGVTQVDVDTADSGVFDQVGRQRTALEDRDVSAFGEESVDDAASDAASPAGHKRNLSLQQHPSTLLRNALFQSQPNGGAVTPLWDVPWGGRLVAEPSTGEHPVSRRPGWDL